MKCDRTSWISFQCKLLCECEIIILVPAGTEPPLLGSKHPRISFERVESETEKQLKIIKKQIKTNRKL